MKQPELIFILVSLRSLYNVGSIFRTADALGVKKIYLTGFTGTPNQNKVAKTALGAEKSVPWEYTKSTSRLVSQLRADGYTIIGLEKTKTSKNALNWKPKKKLAILLGNEERGLSPRVLKLCDEVVHLPMAGLKESLNVSVAAGAIGYLVWQKSL